MATKVAIKNGPLPLLAPEDVPSVPEIGLGLTLWQGTYEGKEAQWLRWCDQGGKILPTGAERAERLAAQLRALGIEPSA